LIHRNGSGLVCGAGGCRRLVVRVRCEQRREREREREATVGEEGGFSFHGVRVT
jgi:hypothetical protein